VFTGRLYIICKSFCS